MCDFDYDTDRLPGLAFTDQQHAWCDHPSITQRSLLNGVELCPNPPSIAFVYYSFHPATSEDVITAVTAQATSIMLI